VNTSFALKNVGLGVTFVNELIDGKNCHLSKVSMRKIICAKREEKQL